MIPPKARTLFYQNPIPFFIQSFFMQCGLQDVNPCQPFFACALTACSESQFVLMAGNHELILFEQTYCFDIQVDIVIVILQVTIFYGLAKKIVYTIQFISNKSYKRKVSCTNFTKQFNHCSKPNTTYIHSIYLYPLFLFSLSYCLCHVFYSPFLSRHRSTKIVAFIILLKWNKHIKILISLTYIGLFLAAGQYKTSKNTPTH